MSSGNKTSPKVPAYFVGIHYVLCHGCLDVIGQVKVADAKLLDAPITNSGEIRYVYKTELFGGLKREGGIAGNFEARFGEPTQGYSGYLDSVFAEAIPAYRGVSSLILQQVYMGLNYYMKEWSVGCQRIYKRIAGTPQWYPATSNPCSHDMNAVHILRECLTDVEWGKGVPEVEIDPISWEYAADVCYTEKLGFSFLWTRTNSLADFIEEVCSHIQAFVYLDRHSGLWKIKLLRQENLDSAPVLNSENCASIELSKRSLEDTISELTIKYIDNITETPRSLTGQNPALIARQGAIVSKEISYSGVANAEVAKRLLDRDLFQMGLQIYSGSLECSRDFDYLNIGDVFLLSYPEIFGDTALPFRVQSLSLGNIAQGFIRVQFYQDIYNTPITVITPENSSLYIEETRWSAPSHVALPVSIRKYIEIPYYFVARLEGDATAQGTPTYQTWYIVAGKSPSGNAIDASITVNDQAVGTLDFCYTALTVNALDRVETAITLDSSEDLDLLSAGYIAQLGEELVYIESIAFPNLTVRRGILDTVPVSHSAGTRFYALQNYNGIDRTKYTVGETVNVKLLTNTSQEQLAPADAPLDTIPLSGRMHKPYRPANPLINGVLWNPERPRHLTVTFASRNRFLETTASPIGFYEPSITSEPDLTYTIEVYDNGTLIDSHTGTALSLSINLSGHTFTTHGRIELYSTNAFGNSERIHHTFSSTEGIPTFDNTDITFDTTTYTMDEL